MSGHKKADHQIRNRFDRTDYFVALGLFAVVTSWAFLWAYPFPHPCLWPCLNALQGRIDYAVFAVAGRFSLGLLSAFIYLTLRGMWLLHRKERDDLPDGFFHTRSATLCGALIFALSPLSWRAGQFLSPNFALVLLTLLAYYLWFCGRVQRGVICYSVAYFLFGLVFGAHFFGLAALCHVAVSDSIMRWSSEQSHGQRESDLDVMQLNLVRKWVSFCSGCAGALAGAGVLAACVSGNASFLAFPARFAAWKAVWTGALMDSLSSSATFILAVCVMGAVMGLAFGRRIRRRSMPGDMLAPILGVMLMLAAVTMLARSVDREERNRLLAIRDYAALVADEAGEAAYTEWSERVLTTASDSMEYGAFLGDVDQQTRDCFDAILWKAARLAGERADQCAEDDERKNRERRMERRLDEFNASLRLYDKAAEPVFAELLEGIPLR